VLILVNTSRVCREEGGYGAAWRPVFARRRIDHRSASVRVGRAVEIADGRFAASSDLLEMGRREDPLARGN
jgi:hypothetical protein